MKSTTETIVRATKKGTPIIVKMTSNVTDIVDVARGAQLLNGVSFDLHPGEIIGIAALEGNGQAELAEVITGLRKATDGEVYIRDRKMDTSSAVDFIDAGVSCVPADRVAVGSVKEDPLYQNWILRKKNPLMRFGLLNYKKIKEEAKKAIADYDVRTTGIKQNSGLLSGGNMQKFILARELDKNPQVLVCSYPTRGLDMKATYFIRDTIESVKEKGVGVVLFSGEMDELFALSDRIIVLYKGKVVGELTPYAYTPFEGLELHMTVEKTIACGKVLMENGTDFSLPGAGKRLYRKLPGDVK